MTSFCGEHRISHTLYAIKGSCRRGRNSSRFTAIINIEQPAPSCFGNGAYEESNHLSKRTRGSTLGCRRRSRGFSTTFPESVFHKKELSSLCPFPFSSLCLPWPSAVAGWWCLSVDQVRMNCLIKRKKSVSASLSQDGWFSHKLLRKLSEGMPLSLRSPGLNLS